MSATQPTPHPHSCRYRGGKEQTEIGGRAQVRRRQEGCVLVPKNLRMAWPEPAFTWFLACISLASGTNQSTGRNG